MERQKSRGPEPIANAIRDFLRSSGLRRPAADARALSAWSEAAGERWKSRATPVAFRGGQLTVEVASSVVLAELKGFHGESIRTRANQKLQDPLIRKVVFKLKS